MENKTFINESAKIMSEELKPEVPVETEDSKHIEIIGDRRSTIEGLDISPQIAEAVNNYFLENNERMASVRVLIQNISDVIKEVDFDEKRESFITDESLDRLTEDIMAFRDIEAEEIDSIYAEISTLNGGSILLDLEGQSDSNILKISRLLNIKSNPVTYKISSKYRERLKEKITEKYEDLIKKSLENRGLHVMTIEPVREKLSLPENIENLVDSTLAYGQEINRIKNVIKERLEDIGIKRYLAVFKDKEQKEKIWQNMVKNFFDNSFIQVGGHVIKLDEIMHVGEISREILGAELDGIIAISRKIFFEGSLPITFISNEDNQRINKLSDQLDGICSALNRKYYSTPREQLENARAEFERYCVPANELYFHFSPRAGNIIKDGQLRPRVGDKGHNKGYQTGGHSSNIHFTNNYNSYEAHSRGGFAIVYTLGEILKSAPYLTTKRDMEREDLTPHNTSDDMFYSHIGKSGNESMDYTLPVESGYLIFREGSYSDINAFLIDNGYSSEWIDEHVIILPPKQKGISTENENSLIREYIKSRNPDLVGKIAMPIRSHDMSSARWLEGGVGQGGNSSRVDEMIVI